MPKPYAAAFLRPPVLSPFKVSTDPDGAKVNHYRITMRQAAAQILPRKTTNILGFNGIFPGPTIELEQGTRSMVHMRNQLPKNHPTLGHLLATSTHLHGSASLPQYDGYASDVTLPGFYKDYFYPNFQPARTLWYHDHGVHFTAQNVYSGLAAMYIMHDKAERELLPQDAFDVPLIISDAMFARGRQPWLRRPRPLRALGRRGPGQRQALAGDAGPAPGLPLPDPQRHRSRARTGRR